MRFNKLTSKTLFFSGINNESHSLLKSSAKSLLQIDLHSILESITDDHYVKNMMFHHNSSVGGHVRHLLDHYNCLFDAFEKNEKVYYDIRNRNTTVEKFKSEAIKQSNALINRISSLSLCSESPKIVVVFLGDHTTGEQYECESTFHRELSFVSHHAVHHLSTIKLMMESMGYSNIVNTTIGVAKSTLRAIKPSR